MVQHNESLATYYSSPSVTYTVCAQALLAYETFPRGSFLQLTPYLVPMLLQSARVLFKIHLLYQRDQLCKKTSPQDVTRNYFKMVDMDPDPLLTHLIIWRLRTSTYGL